MNGDAPKQGAAGVAGETERNTAGGVPMEVILTTGGVETAVTTRVMGGVAARGLDLGLNLGLIVGNRGLALGLAGGGVR